MDKLKIVYKKIEELVPYANNPRLNDGAVEAVANSIKEFGWRVPVILGADNVVAAGHTRIKAAQQLGIKDVPCVMADDLSPEQQKALRLADNKVGELASWDMAKLDEELAQIDMDMEQFGFTQLTEDDVNEVDDTYANDIPIPQYEITGANPELADLCDESKALELMERIEQADVPDDIKEFLRKAATRHYAFNYRNVAEYYAHAPKEVQELMEESALVVIDYDNAMRNGYVRLSAQLESLIGEEQEE